MKTINVIFFGTPWIAKECLEELSLLDNVNIQALVCQPDKNKNRKNEYIFCETKTFALSKNIKVFQPEKIGDIYQELQALNPDIIITCAYGQFVPEKILNIPKFKCVNLHASLLPELRGGAPIHWAILNQCNETGITMMYMVKKMDAGNIIFQDKVDISNNETYSSLLVKLAHLARVMIKKYFYDLCNENIRSIEQDETKVTFGLNIIKDQEIINFNQTIDKVDAQIRGLYNKPLAKFNYLDKTYKVHEAIKTNNHSSHEPGTIVAINKSGLEITTKDFNILITKIQAPNKNPIEVKQYINGNNEFVVGNKLN